MVLVFVHTANTLSIHDDSVNLLASVGSGLYRRAPHPEAFGARIDGWANSKALLTYFLIQKHSIQQITLAGSVHTNHRDDGDLFLEKTGKLLSLWLYFKLLCFLIEQNERYGLVDEITRRALIKFAVKISQTLLSFMSQMGARNLRGRLDKDHR